MNFLPLILIALLLFRKNDSPILEFIKNIDIESVAPVLELLGVNENSLEILNNENFKNFLAGNGDIKSLLPVLLTLINSLKTTSEPAATNFSDNIKSEYLSPIKDIANIEIENSLSEFLN